MDTGEQGGWVSYLHCPTCARAFNLARQPECPHCAQRRDPVDEIVAAARALARAIERATSTQLLAARHALDGELPLRALVATPAAALPKPKPRRLLASVMSAMIGRMPRALHLAVSGIIAPS